MAESSGFTEFDEIVGGESGFVRTGYLVVVKDDDRAGLQRNVALLQELGINTSVVTPDDVSRLAPAIRLYDDEHAAWEPLSGYANPHQVTVSYAARSREAGAHISIRNPAVSIAYDGSRVQAVTTRNGERIATETVIIAAGPWSSRLLSAIA